MICDPGPHDEGFFHSDLLFSVLRSSQPPAARAGARSRFTSQVANSGLRPVSKSLDNLKRVGLQSTTTFSRLEETSNASKKVVYSLLRVLQVQKLGLEAKLSVFDFDRPGKLPN